MDGRGVEVVTLVSLIALSDEVVGSGGPGTWKEEIWK